MDLVNLFNFEINWNIYESGSKFGGGRYWSHSEMKGKLYNDKEEKFFLKIKIENDVEAKWWFYNIKWWDIWEGLVGIKKKKFETIINPILELPGTQEF